MPVRGWTRAAADRKRQYPDDIRSAAIHVNQEPAGGRRPSAHAIALGGVLSLAAVMGIGRFIYTPILPVMAEALDLSASQAGLIASANYLGYLLGALAAASSHIGGSPRRWFFGAFALSAATTLATALVVSMPAFLAIRFLGGFASAFVIVFSSPMIMERLIARGHAPLSMLQFGGVGVGIAISAVLVAVLVASGFSWQALWIGGAVLTLLFMAAVAGLVRGEGRTVETPPATGRLAGAAWWLIFTSYGLFGFGYVITATFIVAIVRGSAELASLEPVIWIVVGLAGAPSIWFWNRIAGRTGLAVAYSLACLVEALGVFLSVAFDHPAAAIAAAVMLGGTFMALTAVGVTYARRITGADPRRTFAIMTVAFGLGQIVGPIVAGYLHDMTGSFAPGSYAAAFALVIGAVLAMASRQVAGFRE